MLHLSALNCGYMNYIGKKKNHQHHVLQHPKLIQDKNLPGGLFVYLPSHRNIRNTAQSSNGASVVGDEGLLESLLLLVCVATRTWPHHTNTHIHTPISTHMPQQYQACLCFEIISYC